MPMRVLLALAHRIYREGLRETLNHRDHISVVGETGDGRNAVRMARELLPDVVVLHAHLPGLNGADVTRELRAGPGPHPAVIALSSTADFPVISRVLKAGAQALVLAGGGLDELDRAFVAVKNGTRFLSPEAESVVLQSLDNRAPSVDDLLTPREVEVLQLLAEGHSTKDIAATLAVSVKTVETHRMHVMAKLRLHSVAELTKYAIRQGLTTALP